MDSEQFAVILQSLTKTVSEVASKRLGVTVEEAREAFMASNVYSLLEVQETRFWHYSPIDLALLLEDEMRLEGSPPPAIKQN